MKGADEYYDLFNGRSQQIGRLFFQMHTHARGKCFEIFIIPDGIVVDGVHVGGIKDVVEIYGMTGGQRGWTETYGWIHKGKWQEDFEAIIIGKRALKESNIRRREKEKKQKDAKAKKAANTLLADYN